MKNLRLLAIVGVAFALVFTGGLSAAAGDLDATFDGDGIVITDLDSGSYDVAFGLAVQGDGKVLLAGETQSPTNASFAVVRYDSKGALDPSFDADGKVRTDFTPSSGQAGESIAVQVDGKIVVAGAVGIPDSGTGLDFALARYNPDGSLDSTFGGDGKVVTNFASATDWAFSVALQPDGKIVAAGISRVVGQTTFDFAVARYNQDGSLDATFDGDGRVVTPIAEGSDDAAFDVVVQSDEKIVVGGYANEYGVLVRYTAGGVLDSAFGAGGKVVVDTPTRYAYGLALQKDGKILTTGTPGFSIARFNPDGSVDTSFGQGGNATAPFDTDASSQGVAVQSDGKIVAAGNGPHGHNFVVARFKPNGQLDTAFSSDGMAESVLGGPLGSDIVSDAGIAPDGKIVVAGGSRTTSDGPFDFAVVRYLGAPRTCKVPNVRGRKLAAARKTIKKARCAIGKITRKPSKQAQRGRVLSQRPKAGTRVPNGTKVNLLVGQGRRR
jgi:uncharacterized delta-60 repeat protein